MSFDYDFIIVGSGFGGSVSAMRLREKGYSVCVLEQGKRFADADFAKSNWDLRRYLWMPFLKCFGIQKITLFKNVLIFSGAGVGGGSLVYANTLVQPGDEFYAAPIWKNITNWKAELEPHYQTAKKMLGVAVNPKVTDADRILLECARDLGREDTFRMAEVGVFFGPPGESVPDPYFGGEGPVRQGCTFCGGCMVGCRHGAKNTLVKNYLYFAEKWGAKILPEKKVFNVEPLAGGGYRVHMVSSTAWFKKNPMTLTARRVILSGGVLGTIALLLKCKYVTRSLRGLSDYLGSHVRTNSEALVGVTEIAKNSKNDHSQGIAISSMFNADDVTHIEPVRYPSGSSFMRLLAAPMADDGGWLIRPIKFFWASLRSPIRTLKALLVHQWPSRSIILLVMQNVDNQLKFRLGRSFLTLFRKGMISAPEKNFAPAPTYIPIANQIGRAFAKKVDGMPMSAVNEVLLNISSTAHVLGGCAIGTQIENGVIDQNHEVFGYRGLYVCDGSAIPANLGVNPSLTITAMTERAMSKIEAKLKN